ncbi:MAG TPA: class I SAM-dependent methyltransferase [Vicinamibacteria bacterium]|nr:class I SAM-dependent methyltransferase [Vicinamibacteria bacterium]
MKEFRAGYDSAHASIFDKVRAHIEELLRCHGAQPQGAGWNGLEAQQVRYEQLAKLFDSSPQPFSVNDLGCGYGALLDYLSNEGYDFDYVGYDISPAMIECAKELKRGGPANVRAKFILGSELLPADYTVACGVFTMKYDLDNQSWLGYVLNVLDSIDRASRLGFAFNMLTKYSDPPLMREELYYADPCLLFDHCKRSYSRNVALLHDYSLYDFTIIVRKISGK